MKSSFERNRVNHMQMPLNKDVINDLTSKAKLMKTVKTTVAVKNANDIT